MANPLKVLTQLSASKQAQFADVVEMQKQVTLSGAEAHLKVTGGAEISGSGALKIEGASQLGSTLAVAGNANLASALDVKGASALSGALGVVGVANFQSDMSGAAGLDLVGAAHIGGALDLDGNLDVGGYAKVVGELSGSAALNIGGQAHVAGAAQFDSSLSVDGNADVDGTLAVVGNISTQASASVSGDLDVDGAADVAGNLDVHGDAVIFGNLEVKGTMTTIESTTVTVADANIQLATVASPTDATADGAGITILGATNKTFQWNDDGHGFTSSEDMNLAAGKVYKIDGQELLAKDGAAAKISYNGGAASVTVDASAVEIAGDLVLADDLHVSGTLGVDGVATFASDISASAGLDVAAAAHFADAVDMDDALNVDGVASFQSDISGAAGLELLGAADIGATLDVAGVASFASDITASANVDVAGNVNLGAASAYKINDIEVAKLEDDGGGVYFTNLKGQGSAQISIRPEQLVFEAGTNNFVVKRNASEALTIDGGGLRVYNAADFDSSVNIDGQLVAMSDAQIVGNITASAELMLSGTAFTNINTPVGVDGYSVNDAIRALDAKAGQQANDINSNYNALRYLAAANFDANGMAAFTSSFAAADIEQVSVDVLVQAGGSGPWTNDLLSVQVKAAGSYVGFEISAPAMGASDKVRIIAVKESGSLA